MVQLEIGAQDGGGLQAEPTARVNISIVPGTPTPPIFDQLQYVFSVPEDVAPGTSVGIVQAHNPAGIRYPSTVFQYHLRVTLQQHTTGSSNTKQCGTQKPP